jgi:transposase
MEIVLTDDDRAAPEEAAAGEPRVRCRKRLRAVLLLADGQPPPAVAVALDCAVGSAYNWAKSWRAAGIAGLREGPHPGGARLPDATGEAALAALLGQDPQARGHHAAGWTVPLLRTASVAAGHEVSERTVRRSLHRLGYRGKRPGFVLGRPDPASAPKKTPSPPAPGWRWRAGASWPSCRSARPN